MNLPPPSSHASMKAHLETNFRATYFMLRFGAVTITILLPFLLWLGGKFYAGLPLQDSMSAYYHAINDGKTMRDWFVGILFAMGLILYFYKGYSDTENIALNIAGILAVGVAIFPMGWGCGENCPSISIHGICAVTFFVIIAFVCVYCSRDTLNLIRDEGVRARYGRIYKTLAIVMVLSPVVAFLLNAFFRQYNSRVFYIEAFGILAFAAYWFVKSRELAVVETEKKLLEGNLI